MRRANFTGTKFGGGGKRGRAKIPSPPPTPFLFARPSENYQKSASGFSRKKVRISFRTDSNVIKFAARIKPTQTFSIILPNLIHKSKINA